MNTLKAEKRDMETKAKKLRREGFVTGNIFGKEIEGSIPVKMEKAEVDKLLKTKNKGSQIVLDVDGQKMHVLIKEVDYNTLKKQVDEVDFQALVSGEKVHSVAEVVLLNHEMVMEGVLEPVLTEIAYKAVPEALVEKVEIDVANMKPGESVKVKDLPIASNKDIDLMTDLEMTVVTVLEAHNAAVDDTEEETVEEA
ncbi:50S ribosomal protein L25 [bacterium]|uniref:50S ribosomal protein L25 n=1 Tax=Lachnospiraceae TaxID=186803 RepID=UPI002A27355A|nr:50S ribosomal protein L25 [bacterium]MDY2885753.1 50S ribosomal protein L25 [Bariatricus sp.]MCI7150271.1 50S ribosomal protein L25 [bacterium]MDD6514731.1 50S ribosomal protein L25 [bacterium]MDD7142522.1 50S ribosomal protein L25 [bacterium]